MNSNDLKWLAQEKTGTNSLSFLPATLTKDENDNYIVKISS